MSASRSDRRVVALSGGVGGAKLCLGLERALHAERRAEDLLVVCNTGDDFEHLGLVICPDLDTVVYTLAGLADRDKGWGRADESWHALEELERLGGETWFQLGDRDLGLHLVRSHALRTGATLSEVTERVAGELGLSAAIAPMSDEAVQTRVLTPDGELAFQHYFVRDRCEPEVNGFRFAGLEHAQPSPRFAEALHSPETLAFVVCPSNPLVSVDPILAVPGVTEALARHPAPLVAVSPIVGGQALKGPAAKMMTELGIPVSPVGIARHYLDRGRLDGLVLDIEDETLAPDVEALGVATLVTETVMTDLASREALARDVLDFVERLRA